MDHLTDKAFYIYLYREMNGRKEKKKNYNPISSKYLL